MTEKDAAPKADKPKADEPEVSKAHQERIDEMHRTHVVPSGYSFNARQGLHKTPVKVEK